MRFDRAGFAVVLTLAGCAESGNTSSTTTTPMTTVTSTTTPQTTSQSTTTYTGPFEVDIPNGGCGLPEYEWIPPMGLGQIVEWEELETTTYTPEFIDLLLLNFGLDSYTPTKYSVETYKIRYTSQDRGVENEVTGIVSFPILESPDSVPVMLQTHPTMGFNDDCAPSEAGLEGIALNLLFSAHGFAVAGPDYLGLKGSGEPSDNLHPYVHAEATAIASLDSLRALVNFADEHQIDAQPDKDRTVFFGASEGGFAALWSERYMPSYAPEFTAIATVASVPPTDLLALARAGALSLSDTTWGGVAVLGTQHGWYGETVAMDTLFTDTEPDYFASTVLDHLWESCGDYGESDEATSPSDIFHQEYLDALIEYDMDAIYPWGCYMEQGILADDRIPLRSQTPTLIVGSGEDELVTISTIRDSIEPLCDLGYEIEYIECAGADHVDGVIASAGYQWEWLQARLNGEPLTATCVVEAPVACEVL